jgi:hypothetical protein
MLGSREILRNRPYFGGLKSDQIRCISDLNWCKNVLSFNIYSGIDGLYHIISCPFKMEDDCWYVFLEEVGNYHRTSDIKIKLERYSVVCYQNGEWEKEFCLIKTNVTSLKDLRTLLSINAPDYFPKYY